jgi:hypothetical protein
VLVVGLAGEKERKEMVNRDKREKTKEGEIKEIR